MPRESPYSIVLSAGEKAYLERLSRKYTAPYNVVVRAKVLLLAAEGLDNETIGQRLDLPRQIVSKWRKRFYFERMGGLEDRERPRDPDGRPVFPPEVVVQVKALACELPYERGIPLSRFSCREIAAEAMRRGIVAQISDATVWRWLDEDAIKPWQHRSWIYPRDPEFEGKAGEVLDLYQGLWRGEALGADEYVICSDEKTSIQARLRIHPTQPAQGRQSMRVEHEYQRG
ncbi:MAG: helix-turn-helix domain-containing protein, partial [Spirochaetia bacterium]